MKPCPLCAELNFDDAVNCKWCNASLSESLDLQSPAPPEGTSGKATASLICGIFFLFWPLALAAVILGHIARSEIRRSKGRLKGAGTAMAGLVLGYCGVALIPVILIIAAIAIPNLLRAKMVANEASAVSSLRTLNVACASYAVRHRGNFPHSLPDLRSEGKASSNAVDQMLAGGNKNGYNFSYRIGRAIDGVIASYTIQTDPNIPGTTGSRHFFTDESGVIRVEADKPATAESPPLH